MDYIERMQKSGLLDFDDVNTRIKEHDDLRKAVIEESEDVHVEDVKVEQPTSSTEQGSNVVDAVNAALEKVQNQTKKQVAEMQTVVDALHSKIGELEQELETVKEQQAQVERVATEEPRTPQTNTSQPQPTSEKGETTKNKDFKPKFSDYGSDDVKVQDIFNVNK